MQDQRIEKYNKYVVAEDFLLVSNYNNIMELPAFLRAVINTTSKEYLTERRQSINALAACFLLSGQKSLPTRARKSIAGFKLREGALLGCRTTLRKKRLYTIIDKLLVFALPRLHSADGNKVTFLSQRTGRISSNVKQSSTFPALPTVRGGQIYHFFLSIKDLLLIPELQEFLPLLEPVRGINLGVSFSNPRIKETSLVADFLDSIRKKKRVLEIPQHSHKPPKGINGMVGGRTVINPNETAKPLHILPNYNSAPYKKTNCLLTLPFAGSTIKKCLEKKSWYDSQEWTKQSLVLFEKMESKALLFLLSLHLERGLSQNQNLKNELIHYTFSRSSKHLDRSVVRCSPGTKALLFEEKENRRILFLTSFQYPKQYH